MENASGLALCYRRVGLYSTNIKIKAVPNRWVYFFFVFYIYISYIQTECSCNAYENAKIIKLYYLRS
jgi:hypothetical protein